MAFNQTLIIQQKSIDYRFSESDFDLSRWRSAPGSQPLSGGRGGSQKIILNDEPYVLRHYLRGGWVARLTHDQYLWTGVKRSRPYLEKHAVELALQQGLPVPAVAAYRIQKSGLWYRAAIISRFIENEGTLATMLYRQALAGELWFRLGLLIRQMHRAQLFHADLNANNILLDGQNNFYLIDFDKARIIPDMGALAGRNIQRLLRSLHKIQHQRQHQKQPFHFNMEQWQQLLAGYKAE